jgi:hypothetical protein
MTPGHGGVQLDPFQQQSGIGRTDGLLLNKEGCICVMSKLRDRICVAARR